MSITLHQATEAVRDLLDQIDPETGELPEGFDDARAIVAHKAVAVAAYILETGRSIDAAKEYAKELAARIKTEERREEWLKRYLREHMQAAGISEIKGDRGIFKATLATGRDESVEVFDEMQLPQLYLRETIKVEPDKTLIKQALKDGHDVPGARIVKRDRLTIK